MLVTELLFIKKSLTTRKPVIRNVTSLFIKKSAPTILKSDLIIDGDVAKSCPTLCDPMDCSMPGFPVLHYLHEFAQAHVRWVSDTIQTFHSSPLALNLSQYQSLFQGVSSLHQVAKVLELQLSAPVLQMNIQGWLPLGLTGLISLQLKGLSRRHYAKWNKPVTEGQLLHDSTYIRYPKSNP